MKVMVYRNLHKEGYAYSIKSMEGISKGRVIGYAKGISLSTCKLLVSEAGRQRVIKQKRKNVHAGIVGDLIAVCEYKTRILLKHSDTEDVIKYNEKNWQKNIERGQSINYNPYLHKTFVLETSGHPIFTASKVNILGSRVEAIH